MNGFDSDTIVRLVTPWWQTALLALSSVTGVLAGVGVAGYVAVWCVEKFATVAPEAVVPSGISLPPIIPAARDI